MIGLGCAHRELSTIPSAGFRVPCRSLRAHPDRNLRTASRQASATAGSDPNPLNQLIRASCLEVPRNHVSCRLAYWRVAISVDCHELVPGTSGRADEPAPVCSPAIRRVFPLPKVPVKESANLLDQARLKHVPGPGRDRFRQQRPLRAPDLFENSLKPCRRRRGWPAPAAPARVSRRISSARVTFCTSRA